MFDYGRQPAQLGATPTRATTRAWPTADGTDVAAAPDHRPAPRLRGRAGRRPHAAQGGRLSGSARCRGASTRRPYDLRRGLRAAGLDRAPLAALAGPRRLPRPSVAQLPPAQRAHPEGADLRADRCAGRRRRRPRCRRRPAASATTTTASPGSATRRSRCGGCTRSGFDWEADDFFFFIADVAERDDELQIMYGIGGERDLEEHDARPPPRLRRRPAGADRQRRATASSQHDVWGAVLDSVYIHTKSTDRLDERIWPILKRQVECALKHWREPDAGIWEVRGEPQHFTSSKIMCWVAARPRRPAGPAARRAELAERVAGGRRRDPRRHLRQRRRRARRVHPVLRHRRRSTRRCC